MLLGDEFRKHFPGLTANFTRHWQNQYCLLKNCRCFWETVPNSIYNRRNRKLKYQTFSRGRRQPEVKFTSDPRFLPTGSAVATLRRLCLAFFDVACKTWVSLLWFSCFYIILPAMSCTWWYLKCYSIVLALVRAIVKNLYLYNWRAKQYRTGGKGNAS